MADSVKNGTDEERVKNRKRFELELEFVQALANPLPGSTRHPLPTCLHQLSKVSALLEGERLRQIHPVGFGLSLPSFLVLPLPYLSPLRAAFSYPHALHHLELLQHAEFRSEIMKDEWRECLNQKQFDHWRTWYIPSRIQVTLNTECCFPQERTAPYQPVC